MTYKTYVTRTIQGAVLALCAVALSGCAAIYSPRSIDSYNSTFRKGPDEPNQADPYTFGGMADGSGGTIARTSYATDSHSTDPRSATETGRSAMTDAQRIDVPAPSNGVSPASTSTASPTSPPVIHPANINPQKGTPMNNQPIHG